MAKKQIVNKDYALISARYKLSTIQIKIVLKVISLINNKNDTDFMVYQLPLNTFNFITDNENYTRLKQECRRLMEKVLEVDTDNGWLLTHWFSSIEYKKISGIIECSIDPKLKPYLLQLKKNFKPYELSFVMEMDSEYSMRIYELCKQAEGTYIKERKIILKDLQDILQVPKTLLRYSNFKQKVLDISVKEINQYSDIKISYEAIKRGRAVYELKFDIKKNEANILKHKVEPNSIRNEDIKDFEEFKILFLKFKFDIGEFENELENFKLFNDNNLKRLSLDNFKKWCMQKKRKQTEVSPKEEQKNYRWDFRKAKDISDKIKDHLEFEKGINWLDDYYWKDLPIPGIGWQKVMHPDFNKEEILLYKLDSKDDNSKYLLDNKTDEILDIEIINND
jgi:plasmid replication initiation protein